MMLNLYRLVMCDVKSIQADDVKYIHTGDVCCQAYTDW